MEIYNTQIAHKAHTVTAPHFRGTNFTLPTESNRISSTAGRDEIVFSPEARQLSETDALRPSTGSDAPPRLDLINRIRSEIASGTYDSPDKMDAALDRMFDRFSGGF